MTQLLPQCENLQAQVDSLLHLLNQEPSLRMQDITGVQASLKKAISPKFEIVFAGAFSAGKSMLINALLERELLYSAEGHATGTECYIEYAEAEKERVVLTFLSQTEIKEQADALCKRLGLTAETNLQQREAIELLTEKGETIIKLEGGESKSERAKQAKALVLLLKGYADNSERIHPTHSNTFSMEQFDFSNLKEAAGYARRGSNSAVLKRIEYYCHHPLLQDGNVLIDMPGIDAPVKKDAELTYRKIEDPETSAVVCVLKPASEGDMTTEETELLEKMRKNPGIRDRVFYVFNRVDETWYNTQLRQRLDDLINSQFRDNSRVYKTSGLLGFYGSQIKGTSQRERYGLDSLFAQSVKGTGIQEETSQFINEFNRYCANSGKLSPNKFKIAVFSYETPNENYARILNEQGSPLIDQLISDSGIEEFRTGITRYLKEEKRPQLFEALANDLQPVCVALRRLYLEQHRELESQPINIEGVKSRRLEQLNYELGQIGTALIEHISQEVNETITNQCPIFEEDFRKLKVKMVSRMDELLNTFSVEEAYRRATHTHPRNSTAPLLAILVEAFYFMANELEEVLVAESQQVIANWFVYLMDRIRHQEYYRQMCRLIGTDAGVEQAFKSLETQVQHAIRAAASSECDRYVRESARFYDENTFSIYQFRQVLQQTSQAYDCASMVEAEPAIRQLLKMDFEPKVKQTIQSAFRQTINQTFKTHLLPLAKEQEESILQQYNRARAHLEKTLEKEAQEQLDQNQKNQTQLQQTVNTYNEAVGGINQCLQGMQLDRYQLPVVKFKDDFITAGEVAEANPPNEQKLLVEALVE
ncbi:dynamin-like GTPase family protein [Microcoleus sp. FACHB-672]|uniref:dynamin-like GTPase family protein n=1 Tax=Microcoleus sp. FACHB-672 TaxID=2692825 RepID=UPI001685C54B|nr:dynamin-like GTPase family protein [Microcoleus sp. FACHB-672]MBD2039765.1 dynamin family protein [Microcoleus sp. FACHB-672]